MARRPGHGPQKRPVKMSVRRAREGDRRTLWRWSTAAHKETKGELPELAKSMGEIDLSGIWVAHDERGRLLGMTCRDEVPIEVIHSRTGGAGESISTGHMIHHSYVPPRGRGGGAYKFLMTHVIQEADAKGLTLLSIPINPRVEATRKKTGFTNVGIPVGKRLRFSEESSLDLRFKEPQKERLYVREPKR